VIGDKIYFCGGFKYQLMAPYRTQTDILPAADVVTEYVLLGTTGMLSILSGFAWDGPSGPSVDTLDFMRASLVHDALYFLIRTGRIDETWRERADNLLRSICLEDGMPHVRAELVYQGVRIFGDPYAAREKFRPIVEAP